MQWVQLSDRNRVWWFETGYAGGGQIRWLRRIDRRNRDRYAQFTSRFTLVHSARRRHIGVIPPDGHAHVPFATRQIIRRVERNPSQLSEIRFHPGVRRSRGRPVLGAVRMKEISAYIAA